ncbi:MULTISPECIES: hypothetical protein [Achromobacter]|uniref:Uncharacterized protein n=1 Tax=Achromobacter denitrificans TaxID=32002 RepID=A0A6N0JGR4_ACHDE|nr:MULTISPECIES: hypothetical protein [Achromobacter]MDF3862789.1 hypothetical protein [Achromobacter denitrificans]QKQ46262.1 hypothetical protein FOC81_06000 [Achromobacter denitrificans]
MRAGAASRVPGEAGSLGAQLENFAAQCVITDQAITEVINFRTASGRFVDGLLIVRPYYSENAKRGALVAVVDISARLAAEREAREIKDTVEDLVATLPMAFFRLREEIDGNRRISYLVGHTDRFLRTSLNQIHMNSGGLPRPNVLEDYSGRPPAPRSKNPAAGIRPSRSICPCTAPRTKAGCASAPRLSLLALVDDLLDLSKMEADKSWTAMPSRGRCASATMPRRACPSSDTPPASARSRSRAPAPPA